MQWGAPVIINDLLCTLVIMQDLSNDYLVSLDVSNFEHPVNSSEFELVRQAMIARESGNATMEVWLPIQREVRVWLWGGGQSGVLLTYLSLFLCRSGELHSDKCDVLLCSSGRNFIQVSNTHTQLEQ